VVPSLPDRQAELNGELLLERMSTSFIGNVPPLSWFGTTGTYIF
jgi:hypothetical protein